MKQDYPESTILVISMGFLLLHVVYGWQWALVISFAVGVTGILSRPLSKQIEAVWLKLTQVLSYIMPSILLAAVFYLVVFPVALMSKIFVKDPLMLTSGYDTCFVTVERKFEKQDFEKLW
jgi:pheromone shutdown protein TraB